MPGETAETEAPGAGEIQSPAEGQQGQEISQDYSLQDATDEAFDEQDAQFAAEQKAEESELPAETLEEPTPSRETSQEEPKPEEKPVEAKVEQKLEIPKEYQEAKNFFDNLKNPDYQKQLLQNLAQLHGMKLSAEGEPKVEAPPLTAEQVKFNEIMEAMDPEVKAVFDYIQNEANKRIAKLEAYIEKQEKDAQEARINKARDEFNEFVSANKEAMDKYRPQLDALARKIPGIFSGGKDGLKAALDLVSMEDRIKDAVVKAEKEAISKTLGRSQGVADRVQHHAAAASQQRESHSAGGEKFNTVEEALDAAAKELAGVI